MSSFIEDLGQNILDNIIGVIDNEKDNGGKKQTALEEVAISMRMAYRPLNYYNRQYPYAHHTSNVLLNNNAGYVSASGWIPTTTEMSNVRIDEDFDKIANQFNIEN